MREVTVALNAFVSSALDGLHVSMPGRVESYDAIKQRASVQPLIRRAYTDADGARTTELLPIINDVPVVFPGSGAYSIIWPVARGDTVLLVFSDQSLDRWLVRGGVVDPDDDRSHTLSDAIAIPGLRPFSAPVGSTPGGQVGGPTGPLVISAPGEIHAGGTQGLVLRSEFNDFVARFNDHFHVAPGGGGNTTGPDDDASSAAGTQILKGA